MKTLIIIAAISIVAFGYLQMNRTGSVSGYIASGTSKTNERLTFYQTKIMEAQDAKDVESELEWLKRAVDAFPRSNLFHADYGRRLAEEGYVVEAGPHILYALDPANYSARISNGDVVLYYWLLKYGQEINDQSVITRATQLLATKRTKDVFEEDVSFTELKQSGLSVNEIATLYAAQSYAGFGSITIGEAQSMVMPILEAHPENPVLDRVAADILFLKEEVRLHYHKDVYLASSPEQREELKRMSNYVKSNYASW